MTLLNLFPFPISIVTSVSFFHLLPHLYLLSRSYLPFRHSFPTPKSPSFITVNLHISPRTCASTDSQLPDFLDSRLQTANPHPHANSPPDNGHITQTRLILLDAALVLFMALSIYSYVKFHQQRYREFGRQWWAWLLATGAALACTLGCKMVGLFTFASVGSAVLWDLWGIMDHKRNPNMVRVFLGLLCV